MGALCETLSECYGALVSEEPVFRNGKPSFTILEVLVKPGSKKPGITRENGLLVVRVRERAVDGKANNACVRALAAAYGVAPSSVALVRGARNRHKSFEIKGGANTD